MTQARGASKGEGNAFREAQLGGRNQGSAGGGGGPAAGSGGSALEVEPVEPATRAVTEATRGGVDFCHSREVDFARKVDFWREVRWSGRGG